MTRSIAILTLALAAAVHADEAFAADVTQDTYLITNVRCITGSPEHTVSAGIAIPNLIEVKGVVASERSEGGRSDLYQQNEIELMRSPGMVADVDHPGTLQLSPGDCITALRDGDDLNELIAIIAFDSSPETAYLTLLDMGFSLAEADDMVLGVLVNNEAISIWDVPMD